MDSSGGAPSGAVTGPGWTPVPDPTTLTTEAVGRSTEAFRRELGQLREVIETRLDGNDEQRTLLWGEVKSWGPNLEERLTNRRREFENDLTSLKEVLGQRLTDLEASMQRRFDLTTHLPEQVKADRQADLMRLRELIESRLSAMDTATELVARATREFPTVLEERIQGLRELIGERIDAIDKATDLRLAPTEGLPAQIRLEVDQLRRLHEERFSSIAQQFAERDIRTGEAAKSAKDALDAALQAAKELVNAQGEASSAAAVKSETSFTKQIDQIGTIISTLEKALDARITELKERIDRGEGSVSGASTSDRDTLAIQQAQFQAEQTRLQASQARMQMYALVIAALVVAIGLYSAFHKLARSRKCSDSHPSSRSVSP